MMFRRMLFYDWKNKALQRRNNFIPTIYDGQTRQICKEGERGEDTVMK
jgi:hypothetical protein